jgi:hypothetical protein
MGTYGSEEKTQSNEKDATKQADDPKAALEAFASAAVKWSGRPTPDPKVTAAVALGWRVGQAWAWAQTPEKPPKDELDHLDLTDDIRWSALAGRIGAARKQALTNGEDPKASLTSGKPPATTPDAVKAVRDALLEELYVADLALGKAFLAGWKLHELCAGPVGASGDAHVDKALRGREPLELLLRDLASKLPANATHSVLHSLALWSEQVNPSETSWRHRRRRPDPPARKPGQVAERFHRQGLVWYAMLSGEVAAKDVLRLSDYVGTAEEMLKRLRELAVRALWGKAMMLVLLIVALLVAGFVLLLKTDHTGHIAAGSATLLAAFGLTWKGIAEFFGRAAARGEEALWDAQIDWTIAYRCTIAIDDPSDPKRSGDRLSSHLEAWRRWQKRWPGLG